MAESKSGSHSQYIERYHITIDPLLVDMNEIAPRDVSDTQVLDRYGIFYRESGNLLSSFDSMLAIPVQIVVKSVEGRMVFAVVKDRLMFDREHILSKDFSKDFNPNDRPDARKGVLDIRWQEFRDHMVEIFEPGVCVEVSTKRKRSSYSGLGWDLSISVYNASTWGQNLHRQYVGKFQC